MTCHRLLTTAASISLAAIAAAACGASVSPEAAVPTIASTTTSTLAPTTTSRVIVTTTTSPDEPAFVDAFARQLFVTLVTDGVPAEQVMCAAQRLVTAIGTDTLTAAGVTPGDVDLRYDPADHIPSLRTPDAAQRTALLLSDCPDASQALAARFALHVVSTADPDATAACAREQLTATQANALNAVGLFDVPPGADHDYDLLRYRTTVEVGLILQGRCGVRAIDVTVPTVAPAPPDS